MITENESSPGDIRRAREMARTIIADHFGNKKPGRTVHKASGLSNFVFAVTHEEGDFIVRLSLDPSRLNLFIKEQWAQERAREGGVPVPEVLEVGNESHGHPFMILRAVEGSEATWHPKQMNILREMGRLAALINKIPTSGFGNTFDWSGNQLSRNETWAEYAEKEWGFEAKLEVLKKRRMISEGQGRQLRKIIGEAMKSKVRPALNHGDMRLKNVIVDPEGAIIAILDWEHCTSNLAPEWELSIALHDLSIDGRQFFTEGYGISEKALRESAPLIRAINLINYAPTVEQLAAEKNTARLEQYRTRLSGALDMYSLPGRS